MRRILSTLVKYFLLSIIICIFAYSQDRIIGGNYADPGEYPWMVGIMYTEPSYQLAGGGALIHPEWILTAYHVVNNATDLEARIGSIDITDENAIIRTVDYWIGYPEYQIPSTYGGGDIALLHLSQPVTSVPCLPIIDTFTLLEQGSTVVSIGWGLDENEVYQDILQEVEIEIQSLQTCKDNFDAPDILYSDLHICAGNDQGWGPCSGDSGGPLLASDEYGNYVLIGAVTGGTNMDCEYLEDPNSYFYGIYSNVFEFSGWINSVINNEAMVGVTFANRNSSGDNLGGYLKVNSYHPMIFSEHSPQLPVLVNVSESTRHEFLQNNTYKHHHWNTDPISYQLARTNNYFEQIEEISKFNLLDHISITTNVMTLPLELEFHDPWYLENPDDLVDLWIQPDIFLPVVDIPTNDEHPVFLNQGGQDLNNLEFPYYSVRSPRYFTDETNIKEFDNWTGTDASFNEFDLETPVIFTADNAEVIANYFQYNRGDIDKSYGIDVTDIVLITGIILDSVEETEYHMLAGDINSDSILNVLDVVFIVDCIVDNNPIQQDIADCINGWYNMPRYGDQFGNAMIAFSSPASSLNRGEDINSIISIQSDVPIRGFQFDLEYDHSHMEFQMISLSEASSGFEFGYNEAESGIIKIVVYPIDGFLIPAGNHEVLNVSFNSLTRSNETGLFTLTDITLSGVNGTHINTDDQIEGSVPENYHLINAYPNPFNPKTTIQYDVPEDALVLITVSDLQGKVIETLIKRYYLAGSYSVVWDASGLPSGTYFVKMISGDFTQTQKITLVK